MVTDEQLGDLAQASARIGGNPLLVQGPGGNTSIKDDDELWVKASGVWLAEAAERQVFVPLSRAAVAGSLSGTFAIPPEAVLASRNPDNLRPSIETALHALMPHRVVVHAHAVNAMATAVRADGEALAAERLAGLRWAWIPYRQPGAALAGAVAAVLVDRAIDVLLLQNHGVVVGAHTAAAAEALLIEVERRLGVQLRDWSASDAAALADYTDDEFEPHEAASALAADADAIALLTEQVLVPDQVVFLGGAVPALAPGTSLRDTVAAARARAGISPALLLVPGIGALAARARSSGAESLIAGLIEIARRVPMGMAVTGIDAAEVATLLGWDAEHHRQAMDQARGRS